MTTKFDPIMHKSQGVGLWELRKALENHEGIHTGIKLPGGPLINIEQKEACYLAHWIYSWGRESNWAFELLLPPDSDGFISQVNFYQHEEAEESQEACYCDEYADIPYAMCQPCAEAPPIEG